MLRATCCGVGWIVIWLSVVPSSTPGAERVFRVGTARVEVTPTQPLPMWGYGARHDRLSRGTRDPLWAKAVVIEAGDDRVALVGLDLGRSLGEPHFSRIRDAVRRSSQIEHVLCVGSHTHHGPVLELKDVPGQGKGRFDAAVAYVAELEQKLIRVIEAAAGGLQDARIGQQSAMVEFNRNRHSKREPKPRDPELSVIRLDNRDGKPLAVLVNFAAHPTMLSGADLRWSADYPGALMAQVEREAGCPCVFLQGAAGDLSPQGLPVDDLPPSDPRLALEALDAKQAASLREELGLKEDQVTALQRDLIASGLRMESFGRRLGDEVLRLFRGTETRIPQRPSVKGSYEIAAFESRVNLENPAVRTLFSVAFFPELAAAAAADVTGNQIRPALTTVLLNNDLALVGGSGEFFSSHAVRLKERCYAAKVLFLGYCNGHHMYFPTIEAVSQGGYGADPEVSWVAVGAGEQLMNRALVQIFTWQGRLKPSPFAAPANNPQ